MKVTVHRERLLQAFGPVAAVAPQRSPKPILQNIKFEVTADSATLLATDLEVGIRHQIEGIEIDTPGVVLLPTQRFGNIIRENTDDTVLIETTEKHTIIKGQRSEFQLPAANPGEYPAVAGFDEASYHEVAGRLFKEMIRRTLFATENESSRYALGGIKLEATDNELTAVGTDGRRLAKMAGPIAQVGDAVPFGEATIVPSRSMQLIDRVIPDDESTIRLAVRQNELLVSTPQATLITRLLEGRFPRWREVIPASRDSSKIELPVSQLASATRQAQIMMSEEKRGIDFMFGEGTLVAMGRAAEIGESRVEMPIGYDGRIITIALDPKFLLDFLKVLEPSSTITLDLYDGDSAALCKTDDGYCYVIMPLARDR
jgi:DNA polymerase-3 subunit beta